MAVRIEKGGWLFIFLIGLGLVGYSLDRYGVLNLSGLFGGKSANRTTAAVDPAKPLPASGEKETNAVRVRVNIWVGCAGGLVANGGLDTAPGSIYDRKGLKVSFKIIDDWTEGVAALASNNVDVMLTTADVWAKDYAQLEEKASMPAPFTWWTGRAAPTVSSVNRASTASKTLRVKPWRSRPTPRPTSCFSTG